ncbi:GUN4 domain-containing protein [Pleurocapsales cyanobacterium LEGE 06147]|nr:GUN4 domain-containing protein [Pleurocapsales cyanobacterium LEGE 06147]
MMQLSQLSTQLSEIKTQLNQIPDLAKKVTCIEENLSLVADVYRYEKLRDYLSAGQWKEADRKTSNLIVEIAEKSDIEKLKPSDLQTFPCNALRVIDQLWLNYSQKRFGFSVQLEIYQSVGGDLTTTIEQNQEIIQLWGDRLGWRTDNRWRKCDELDYSLSAPVGCHPSGWWNSPYGSKMTNYFLARLLSCQLTTDESD